MSNQNPILVDHLYFYDITHPCYVKIKYSLVHLLVDNVYKYRPNEECPEASAKSLICNHNCNFENYSR